MDVQASSNLNSPTSFLSTSHLNKHTQGCAEPPQAPSSSRSSKPRRSNPTTAAARALPPLPSCIYTCLPAPLLPTKMKTTTTPLRQPPRFPLLLLPLLLLLSLAIAFQTPKPHLPPSSLPSSSSSLLSKSPLWGPRLPSPLPSSSSSSSALHVNSPTTTNYPSEAKFRDLPYTAGQLKPGDYLRGMDRYKWRILPDVFETLAELAPEAIAVEDMIHKPSAKVGRGREGRREGGREGGREGTQARWMEGKRKAAARVSSSCFSVCLDWIDACTSRPILYSHSPPSLPPPLPPSLSTTDDVRRVE